MKRQVQSKGTKWTALLLAAGLGTLLLVLTLRSPPETVEVESGTEGLRSNFDGRGDFSLGETGSSERREEKGPRGPNSSSGGNESGSEAQVKPPGQILAPLTELEIPEECVALAKDEGVSRESLPGLITETFGLGKGFPRRGHLVRWEQAYGLPEPGVVIWLDWNGDEPSSYQLRVQDGRNPRTWDENAKAPIETLAAELDLAEGKARVFELDAELTSEMGPASYQRVLVTDRAPSKTETGATKAAEVIGDRILMSSFGELSCRSNGEHSLECQCSGGH